MEKLANMLARYIVRDTEHDYEVVKYGIDAILSTTLCFSTALLVCSLLGNFLFGILFIAFLTPIKMQFLGYHCKTMTQCITTYSICSGVLLLINDYLLENAIFVNIAFFILIMSGITFFVRTEINKKNRMFLCVYLIIGTIFYYSNYDLFIMIFLVVIFEFTLLILRHLTD